MENNKLDLLLINPGGTKRSVYQDLSKDYTAIEPPFWAALTAGFLRAKGFNIEILDASALNMDNLETIEYISKKNPVYAAIIVYGQQPAASTQLMTKVISLANEIKKANLKSKLLISGLHPSALPERTLNETNADFVIQGEGFYSYLGLLENKSIQEIKGLWWKQDSIIQHTEVPKNIQDLSSELSEVAWDLLPWGHYKAHNHQCLGEFENRPFYASLSTSLGCPFNCHFCCISASFGGEKRIRSWSPDWVIKQIDILVKKYDVRVIKIIDEMFLFDPKHYMKIADLLIERGYDLNIWAYARTDITEKMDIESLKKIRKAGFKWLCFGFEAASEEVRKGVNKGTFSKDSIIKAVNIVRQADISILGNFIFGLPEDTKESMQKTLDLAKEINCEFVNFYCAMAYPGSGLYNEAIKKGWILPDNWSGFSQHSFDCTPLPTNYITSAEVLKFRDFAFTDYCTNKKYLDMIENKFGIVSRKHIEDMVKIRLKRKLLGDIK